MARKKNAHSEAIVVRALRTRQGENNDVYAFFMPGGDITKVADISRIERDEANGLRGFQRREIRAHVKNIADYLDHGKVLFPNAIILALSNDVRFVNSRGPKPEGLDDIAQKWHVAYPDSRGRQASGLDRGRPATVNRAFKESNQRMPVPVVAFVSDNITTQREQFILVNKAKPLPGRLINELLPETAGVLFPRDLAGRRIPSELCNLLDRDPTSPFHQLIRRPSDPKTKRALVTDTAVIRMIRNSMNNPLGALAPYKGIGGADADIQGMYKTLCGFWNAVRDTFRRAWGVPPTKSRLMHSAGIEAMGVLMDKVLTRHQGKPDENRAIRNDLKRMAPYCHWTEGTWEALGLEWNEIQNITRHIRGLAEALVRIHATQTSR